MKKIVLQILLTLSILVFNSTESLHAADLSVGATVWYTTWDFEWDGTDKISYEPDFLYGPVLSLSINPELNLSFVFLYGEFTETYSNSTNEIEEKMIRNDSDLALNYRISNYFKLFAGAKFIRFTWDSGKHNAIGPGAGISSVFPMGNNFFILANISGMYMYGEESVESYNEKLNEYGFNGSLSLAYYIANSSTTINLGGRYQHIKIDYEGSFNDNTSKFYGITLTAVYTFNI